MHNSHHHHYRGRHPTYRGGRAGNNHLSNDPDLNGDFHEVPRQYQQRGFYRGRGQFKSQYHRIPPKQEFKPTFDPSQQYRNNFPEANTQTGDQNTSFPQIREEGARRHIGAINNHTHRPKSGWDIDDMGKKRVHGKNVDLKDETSGVQNKKQRSKPRSAPVLKPAISVCKSDTDIDERAGADGEAVMWAPEDEVYSEDHENNILQLTHFKVGDASDKYITMVAKNLNLERTRKLHIKAQPSHTCEVPTPPRQLSSKLFRYEGVQKGLGELTTKEKNTTFVVLEPILKEAPPVQISTLAQEFLRTPTKHWWNDASLRLGTNIIYPPKLLLWARMMLVSEEDKAMLLKADIFRGVLASLYRVPINSSLLAAFLTFWNTEGHTLITAQGEMGYPLITVYDAMGLPISGHLYEEHIPPPTEVPSIVKALHAAFADIWTSTSTNSSGTITIVEWLDHFLGEDLGATAQAGANMPDDFYADPEDPLLSRLDFHTTKLHGRFTAIFSNNNLFYKGEYAHDIYRAAFLAAWLCTYCVPVDRGIYIRPEVFSAAASLARGVRLAIGTASLAHLYQSIDVICHGIKASPKSASECQLPLPAHFIMGWFCSYWTTQHKQPAIDTQLTHFPPFIMDAWRITSKEISLSIAHRLFIDLSEDKKSLLSLSFLGRSSIRFPKSDAEILITDTREEIGGGRCDIRITAIDMLISASVGAVTYIRCQFYSNLVYCPHRFARMHGCDQDVPDFLIEGKSGQYLLQFSDYLEGTREETIEHLQRRHLAYYSPAGHQFHLQPLSRRAKCSFEYLKWCETTLNFLQKNNMICSGQELPISLRPNIVKKMSITPVSAVPTTGRAVPKGAMPLSTKENKFVLDTDLGLLATGGTSEKQSSRLGTNAGPHAADKAKSSKTAPHVSSKENSTLAPALDTQILSIKENNLPKLDPIVLNLKKGKAESVSASSVPGVEENPPENAPCVSIQENKALSSLGSEQTTNTTPILLQNTLAIDIETANKDAPSSSKDGVISETDKATGQAKTDIITQVVEAACTETRTPIPTATQPVQRPIDDDAMLVEGTVTENPSSEIVSASDTNLVQLSTEKRVLKTPSGLEDHPDGSPPKKYCLDLTANVKELEEDLSKAKTLQLSIIHMTKCFMDNIGDEFTEPVCNAERQEASKYEGRSKIVVPEFADSGLQALMCYPQYDLKQIQDLIAKPVLDKVSLVTAIEKSLKGWKAIFKGRTIPKEVTELMGELSDLKGNLSSKEKRTIGFCVSKLRSDKELVRERLNIGKKSHKSVTRGLSSLQEYGKSWDQLQTEAEKRKKRCRTEIEELEKALSLARSKLSTEDQYEAKIGYLRDQYNEMLSDTSTAISALEDLLARGESCLISINAAIREAGSQGDSELPISLRQQLKFVESCVIEGNDDEEESDKDNE